MGTGARGRCFWNWWVGPFLSPRNLSAQFLWDPCAWDRIPYQENFLLHTVHMVNNTRAGCSLYWWWIPPSHGNMQKRSNIFSLLFLLLCNYDIPTNSQIDFEPSKLVIMYRSYRPEPKVRAQARHYYQSFHKNQVGPKLPMALNRPGPSPKISLFKSPDPVRL